tara:strand:- start:580 stop:711 length:132 start_codon:yes stop_codon:yes gene_type:complete
VAIAEARVAMVVVGVAAKIELVSKAGAREATELDARYNLIRYA